MEFNTQLPRKKMPDGDIPVNSAERKSSNLQRCNLAIPDRSGYPGSKHAASLQARQYGVGGKRRHQEYQVADRAEANQSPRNFHARVRTRLALTTPVLSVRSIAADSTPMPYCCWSPASQATSESKFADSKRTRIPR